MEPPALPPRYDRWMREALGGPLPTERSADCADCVMILDEESAAWAVSFHAQTRCCTFFPELANFLVGAALAETDAEGEAGRASLRARIAARVAVSPLGLARPAAWRSRMVREADRTFGREPSLRCPHHLDDGRCGVWAHRDATCATWFCKHDRGAAGRALWRDGVRPLLAAVERALSRWCLTRLDLGPAAIAALFPAEGPAAIPEEPHDPAAWATLWGAWVGREEGFYRACAELVAPLTWPDVRGIAGPDVALRELIARARFADLQPRPTPIALRLGEVTLLDLAEDSVTLSTYSPFDPLTLPRALFDALPHFAAAPSTREALAACEARGVRIDPSLLDVLVDHDVLVPRA